MADFSSGFPAWNFSPGNAILPSDGFIVSRFSSLSGCLNPKLRRFAPGLYPLYRGPFIPAGCRSDRLWRPAFILQPFPEQLATFVYALSRSAREQPDLAPQLQAYLVERGGLLGPAQLVGFGQQREYPGTLQPAEQLQIKRGERMARIHDDHDAREAFAVLQIGADQRSPLLAQEF